MKKHFRSSWHLAFAAVFLANSLMGHAASVVNVDIVGVILAAPSCTINNNQPIDVNFGDALLTSKVDGVNYSKPVDVSIFCSSSSVGTGLKIQLQGIGSTFDSTVLKTNNPNLGVELSRNTGVRWNLNSWLNFTYGNTPGLIATPVKNPVGTLSPGNFSGSGTMVLDFQ